MSVRRSARIASKAVQADQKTQKAVSDQKTMFEKVNQDTYRYPIKTAHRQSLLEMMGRYPILCEFKDYINLLEYTTDYQDRSTPQYANAKHAFATLAANIGVIVKLIDSFKDEIDTRKNIMKVVDEEEMDNSSEDMRRFRDIIRQDELSRIAEMKDLFSYCCWYLDILYDIIQCVKDELHEDISMFAIHILNGMSRKF